MGAEPSRPLPRRAGPTGSIEKSPGNALGALPDTEDTAPGTSAATEALEEELRVQP